MRRPAQRAMLALAMLAALVAGASARDHAPVSIDEDASVDPTCETSRANGIVPNVRNVRFRIGI